MVLTAHLLVGKHPLPNSSAPPLDVKTSPAAQLALRMDASGAVPVNPAQSPHLQVCPLATERPALYAGKLTQPLAPHQAHALPSQVVGLVRQLVGVVGAMTTSNVIKHQRTDLCPVHLVRALAHFGPRMIALLFANVILIAVRAILVTRWGVGGARALPPLPTTSRPPFLSVFCLPLRPTPAALHQLNAACGITQRVLTAS